MLRVVEGVRQSPLWKRALASKTATRRGALRAAGRGGGAERPSVPAGTTLQGAIDLVFEEDDGWVLVDYKSDTVTPDNRAALEAFYAPQIDHYRRYWERLTGRPTRAGLFFLAHGRARHASDRLHAAFARRVRS